MSTVALLAFGWLVIYVVICARWSTRKCRKCSGTGKRYSPFSKGNPDRPYRNCGRCDGSGRRKRLGRTVYEVFHGS